MAMTTEQKLSVKMSALQSAITIHAQQVTVNKQALTHDEVVLGADAIYKWMTAEMDMPNPIVKPLVN